MFVNTFPRPVNKITGILLGWDNPNPKRCNSRAVSYQPDNLDCLVARGSLNPMFWQRVPQRYHFLGKVCGFASFQNLKCQKGISQTHM